MIWRTLSGGEVMAGCAAEEWGANWGESREQVEGVCGVQAPGPQHGGAHLGLSFSCALAATRTW
jgi:hypothetical protein